MCKKSICETSEGFWTSLLQACTWSMEDHKLYTQVDKNVHISRDVVFDESEIWKWQTKDTMEDEIKHIYVDYDENGESGDEINGEDDGFGEATQTKSHAHERPQRRKQVLRRLKDCEILPDSEV